ncbi:MULTISPECIES: alpha/beta fold hydrolase [unclassified Marinobacterium]|uniref:alpha/beta fold hydrolase n=1 Tax=unclassified Marinobacterium TaxID=2644139 RepID=UPI001569E0EE|nr:MULTISPECIES: alpha/beta fold hydrolase [unclassified Marinobacterium]NRP09761.1 Poly-beta-hydroxybutyrate polymerase [Marinobacterium sp. xm-g-48]NRP82606.1 Poly-beta-hydroxybutyrate polymerase [Marinobacterium sp. xm-d-509]
MANRYNQALLDSQKELAKAMAVLSELPPLEDSSLKAEVVLTLDKMRLLHFKQSGRRRQPPLIICYALVNRPTILDLAPDRSLVQDLRAKGRDIYLIDWGYPDLCDRHIGLDDYIGDYLDSAVQCVIERSGFEQIDLMGICQGGVFSLAYASLKPERVRKLVTLVTPVDTGVEGFTLSEMVRETNIEQLVKAYGNLPGQFLNQIYAALKPLQLGVVKEMGLSRSIQDPTSAELFLRMEQWINDSPDLAGRAAIEFAETFFKGNGLIQGSFYVDSKAVKLTSIRSPILNIFGTKDHLVPTASSQALQTAITPNTPYQELALPAGHIGAFISDRCRDKVISAIESHLTS